MVAVAAVTSVGIISPLHRRKLIERVTFHHLASWLKVGIDDLCYRKLPWLDFLSLDNRSICGQQEVDSMVGHQIGLAFCQTIIQRPIR